MKKRYISPELEVIRYTLIDVLSSSPTEETIPEVIGGGSGDEIEIGGL